MSSNYVAPSIFMKAHNIKVEAGMTLDPEALGMAPHPLYGQLPVVQVQVAKAGGSIFLSGTATCPQCGEVFHLSPGDWFQKRKCNVCAKRNRGGSKLPEDVKAERKAERDARYAAERIVKAEVKAQEAAARARQKSDEAQQKLLQLRQERDERAALIAKVAAEHGVPVSTR